MNRYEQLILKILNENDSEMKRVSLNSRFHNELIKQRVSGSLSEAFRDAIEILIINGSITEKNDFITLIRR